MAITASKAIVAGRVQGVFYRASTRNKAQSLQLNGYAKNLPDGTVEVLAIGDQSNIDSLLKWLWTGSAASKVRDVTIFNADEIDDIDTSAYPSFTTK